MIGKLPETMSQQRRRRRTSLNTDSRDQFLLAAIQKPTSFRTKFQRAQYEGATARKDAEEDERSRWLHILAGTVLNTDTPMAKMLREKPWNAQLLGAGKRASALRARVRSLRRDTLWLSTACGVPFPSETAHIVDYLRARSQEPTTRGGLKAAHQGMRFDEEITAVPEQENAIWVVTGWQLLNEHAAFERDCLLPSPSDGFRGCNSCSANTELPTVGGTSYHQPQQPWVPEDGQIYSRRLVSSSQRPPHAAGKAEDLAVADSLVLGSDSHVNSCRFTEFRVWSRKVWRSSNQKKI